MEKTYTQIVSEYLAGLKYEDIPQEAIDQAKRLTLHTVGATIGGYPLPLMKRVFDYTQGIGGVEEATIWGSNGKKVPAEEAAYANGTLSDALDWEDCSWTGHPSATAVPAIFAVAEAEGKSGRDYLTALVGSYEVSQRLAMAVQPSREYVVDGRDWGLVSWQILPASCGVVKLLGFDAKQINQHFGAAEYSTIICANKHSEGSAKSDIYHHAHGFCARNGVAAARVTQVGFDNCYDAFDGVHVYWHLVSDKEDPSWYDKDLGKHWLINETYLKQWPANMWVQIPLVALDQAMKKRDFTIHDIAKFRVTPNLPFICGDYSKSTRTILDAQFSIAYCLGAYLIKRKMSADWFTEDMLNSEEIFEFATKFEPYGDERSFYDNFEIFKAGSFPEFTLELYFKDGTSMVEKAQFPKGHPQNNFTLEEEYDHFRNLCSPYMPAEQIERFIQIVDKLEEAPDLHELAAMTVIK